MYLFIILQLKYVHHISNGYNSSTHTYASIYVDTYVQQNMFTWNSCTASLYLLTHKKLMIRNSKTLTCSSCVKNKSTGKEGLDGLKTTHI